MFTSRVLFRPLLAVTLMAATSSASIDLIEEVSFTVRGLSGQIEQIKFNDIDGDGFPEVLASDGQDIVLYSVTGDSVVFAVPLDTAYLARPINFRIELGDVNRDSIGDVVVGYCGFDSWLFDHDHRFIAYDGASQFQQADSVFARSYGYHMWGPSYVPGITAFQALDFDGDGYNELLVSFDSSQGWSDAQLTVGSTHLYHAFPDSLRWQQDYVVNDMRFFDTQANENWFISTEFSYNEFNMPGVDFAHTIVKPVLIKPSGELVRIKLEDDDFHLVATTTLTSRVYRIGCVGQLVGGSNLPDMVLTYDWRVVYIEGNPDSVVSHGEHGSEQAVYSFSSLSTAEKVWSDDKNYLQYFYHSDFPGYYFVISGHLLTQHRGSDGSTNQTFDNLPDGLKDWVYPYGDEQPRLVVSDGNQVSLYRMDIVTGIADGRGTPALPKFFELGQPYPNPFNAQVTIPVTMLRTGRLKVDVFNLLGRKVATVYDGPASVGQRDYHWDAEVFASGVYLFKATTAGETATIKATLLK